MLFMYLFNYVINISGEYKMDIISSMITIFFIYHLIDILYMYINNRYYNKSLNITSLYLKKRLKIYAELGNENNRLNSIINTLYIQMLTAELYDNLDDINHELRKKGLRIFSIKKIKDIYIDTIAHYIYKFESGEYQKIEELKSYLNRLDDTQKYNSFRVFMKNIELIKDAMEHEMYKKILENR